MVKLKVFHSFFFQLTLIQTFISICLTSDLSSTSSVTSSTATSLSTLPSNNVNNVTSTFTCPEQFGYYIDHSDCTKYFVCVFGEALHETCTGGLYLSSELQTCDWPRNVLC